MVGNVFVAAACVAYYGAFTSSYREKVGHFVVVLNCTCTLLTPPADELMGFPLPGAEDPSVR